MIYKSYFKYPNNTDYMHYVIISCASNKLTIDVDSKIKLLRVPIYTIFNKFIFEPVKFPFDFIINNEYIFSEYNGLYKISEHKNIPINFFYSLVDIINTSYKYQISYDIEPHVKLADNNILRKLHYNRTISDNINNYLDPRHELSIITTNSDKYYDYFYLTPYDYVLNDNSNISQDISIISCQQYDNNFIELLVTKYKNATDIIAILSELLKFYTYPVKILKNIIDPVFDQIIYISLYHLDIIKNTSIFNSAKIKHIYTYIIELYENLTQPNFNFVKNNKCIIDYLYRATIKLLLKPTTLSYKLLIKTNNISKLIKQIQVKSSLHDIIACLSWNNIYNISLLNYFYNNKHLIDNKYYSVISCKNIKSILSNPVNMCKYLHNEEDIKLWIKLIEKYTK